MQDKTIRQAISQSLNRFRIVRNIYHNTATVANNIIPDISWASAINTPDFSYDYQPSEAEKRYVIKTCVKDVGNKRRASI